MELDNVMTDFGNGSGTNGVTGGRTGVKNVLFLVIFFVALGGIFAALPIQMFTESDPGLSFQPMLPDSNTLVLFEAKNKQSIDKYTSALDKFLESYADVNIENEQNRVNCDTNNPPTNGKVCRVDVSSNSFGFCTQKVDFGYSRSSPCIFLTLDKINGWNPQFYTSTSVLPDVMPKDLQNFIKGFDDTDKRNERIWITCDGETPTDKENMGVVNFSPHRGFPGYFYPFLNQKGYMQPVMAINFERPKTGIIIFIECKAWALNINHDRGGTVRFQLMVE